MSVKHRYVGTKRSVPADSVLTPATPAAEFSFVVDGLTVYFTDESVAATSWDWTFDDGTPNSTARNPIHTYEGPGPDTYTVTLQINGMAGPLVQHDVNIAAQAPDMDLHITDLTIDEVIGLSIADVLGLKI